MYPLFVPFEEDLGGGCGVKSSKVFQLKLQTCNEAETLMLHYKKWIGKME